MFMETLNRWLPEAILAVLGGLITLVRAGDISRLRAMEKKQEAIEATIIDRDKELYNKIDALAKEQFSQMSDLRKELESRHSTLLGAILHGRQL